MSTSYGGGASDFATYRGLVVPGCKYQVWDAALGGSQLTVDGDGNPVLLDTAGNPITDPFEVESDSLGMLQFSRTADNAGSVWVIAAGAAPDIKRVRLDPANFTARLVAVEGLTSRVDSLETTRGEQNVYNVQEYGAKGDIGTDDTSAIRDALLACSSAGGGIVYFPAGTYRVTSTIVIPFMTVGTIVIQGRGVGVSKIAYEGTGYCFTVGQGDLTTSFWLDFDGLEIYGDAVNADGAIYLNGLRFGAITRCHIGPFTKTGAVGVNFAAAMPDYFVNIQRSRFYNIPTGILLDGGGAGAIGANSNWISRCHFSTHSTYAIKINGAYSNVIDRNEFNGSITTAIKIAGTCQGNKVIFNQFDGPTYAADIDATVDYTFFFANTGTTTVTSASATTTQFNTTGTLYHRNGFIIGGAGTAATNIVPLSVRGVVGQATNFFRVQNSDGTTTYFSVNENGLVTARGGLATNSASTLKADVGGNSRVVDVDLTSTASAIGIKTLGHASQSVDLEEWLVGGAIKARITKGGRFGTQVTSAPADADVTTSEAIFWFDNTVGAPRLMIKAKDSGGTVFTQRLSNEAEVVSKTANYTLTAYDAAVLADATSAAFTVTLPTAVGITGKRYVIKKTDATTNAVTIATTSSQTIDGTTTRILGYANNWVTVVSDGANWVITDRRREGAISKAAAYTITDADDVVLTDASGAARTITLPTAVGVNGRRFTIKKTDSSANAVTIATTSSQTIDGVTTKILSTQYAHLTVVSDNANWYVVN